MKQDQSEEFVKAFNGIIKGERWTRKLWIQKVEQCGGGIKTIIEYIALAQSKQVIIDEGKYRNAMTFIRVTLRKEDNAIISKGSARGIKFEDMIATDWVKVA